MVLIIISIILFLVYAFLMLQYGRGWHKQGTIKQEAGYIPQTSISIIIPARNEEEHIEACIRSILDNKYPPQLSEIIIINDYSTDRTAAIASGLLEGGAGRVLNLKDYLSPDERLNSYKKKALEIAISEAKGDLIITTDADCIAPPNWLNHLTAAAVPGVKFIAAPVSFTPASGRKDLLYYFQSLDFLSMQGITAASAAMKLGNMCNGANLAFSAEAFYTVGGYKGIDHLASGDDMLLMHKIQQQYPSGICYLKTPEAIVETPAQPTWRTFLDQRIRWSSKADKYDDKKLTWILALVYFFNLIFIVLTIAGFFNPLYWLWMAGIIIAKTGTELVFLVPVARFYGKVNELAYFPILQPLHILYIILAGFLGMFGSYQWKGRTVK
jgi:cellulose synthase/poly-beta-1,6-N-acetylglucosamine synthase-like glycosyltransferase